jgi:hypothetical protein
LDRRLNENDHFLLVVRVLGVSATGTVAVGGTVLADGMSGEYFCGDGNDVVGCTGARTSSSAWSGTYRVGWGMLRCDPAVDKPCRMLMYPRGRGGTGGTCGSCTRAWTRSSPSVDERSLWTLGRRAAFSARMSRGSRRSRRSREVEGGVVVVDVDGVAIRFGDDSRALVSYVSGGGCSIACTDGSRGRWALRAGMGGVGPGETNVVAGVDGAGVVEAPAYGPAPALALEPAPLASPWPLSFQPRGDSLPREMDGCRLEMLFLAETRLAASGVVGRTRGVACVVMRLLDAVDPSPSSLRSASAVAATSPTFIDWARERERVDSDREMDGLGMWDTGPAYPAGGVRVVRGPPWFARLVTDDEPRRNWLIEAVDGLGGRCEKSLGAMCRRISWLGLAGVRRREASPRSRSRSRSRSLSRGPEDGGVLRRSRNVCESADVGGDIGSALGSGESSVACGEATPAAPAASWRDALRA